MTSLLRRGATVVIIIFATLGLGVGVASAHAGVVATSPVDGTSVTPSPAKVTVTFSERVSISGGGLSVRNTRGTRVESGSSSVDPSGSTVSVDLQPSLADGTYVATYRVLSADGHPVSASFLVGVGTGPVDPSAAAGGTTGDRTWEILGAIARFVTYVSALLAAGLVVFLAFIHDRADDQWRLIPVVRISTIVAPFGIAGIVVAQAALLSGRGLAVVTDWSAISSALSGSLGWSSLVLMLGLIGVRLATDIPNNLAAQTLALYGGLVTVGSFAMWGHSTELPPVWLSIGADVVHAGAAAVWFGGIVGLAVVLRRPTDQPVASTAGIVARFSTIAAFSVGALAAAGIALGWNASGGSWNAIISTTYGRLLLAKVLVTAVILGVAAYNRSWLVPAIVQDEQERADALSSEAEPSTGTDAEPSTQVESSFTDEQRATNWSLLRRAVRLEAVAIVVVLALTSVLVNVTPSRTVIATRDRVVNQTQTVATGSVNLVVVPAHPGTNTLHIQYLDAAGRPVDVANTLTIEFSLPDQGIGSLSRQVAKASTGHFLYVGPELSISGPWTVTLVARTSDFSEQRTSFEVPIRS